MNTYVHCNMSPWLVFLLEATMRSACGNSRRSKYIKGTCYYLAVYEIAIMIYCETFVKMHRIVVMRVVWNVERHNFLTVFDIYNLCTFLYNNALVYNVNMKTLKTLQHVSNLLDSNSKQSNLHLHTERHTYTPNVYYHITIMGLSYF
jgi:hypothetical protein